MRKLKIKNRKYRQRVSKTHRINMTLYMLNKVTTCGLGVLYYLS